MSVPHIIVNSISYKGDNDGALMSTKSDRIVLKPSRRRLEVGISLWTRPSLGPISSHLLLSFPNNDLIHPSPTVSSNPPRLHPMRIPHFSSNVSVSYRLSSRNRVGRDAMDHGRELGREQRRKVKNKRDIVAGVWRDAYGSELSIISWQ